MWIAHRWPLMERPHFHSNLKRLESAFLWKYCSSSICTSFFGVLGHMSITLTHKWYFKSNAYYWLMESIYSLNDGKLFWRILLLCKLSDERGGGGGRNRFVDHRMLFFAHINFRPNTSQHVELFHYLIFHNWVWGISLIIMLYLDVFFTE